MIDSKQSVRAIVSPVVRFGGKARAAPLVWQALGNPHCFIDPFAGSLAVPLRAPQPLKKVVINDLDDLLVNFWRALQRNPDSVAYWGDYPTSHTDLIARREYLRQQWPHVRRAMKLDPDWYDARLAGWWAWAVSNSIDLLRLEYPSEGSQAWYSDTTASYPAGDGGKLDLDGVGASVDLDLLRPDLDLCLDALSEGVAGQGHGLDLADDRLFPDNPVPFSGERLTPWFRELAQKIQRWIILCKDWRDVVSSRSITSTTATQPGTTCGIFLDPPYNRETIERSMLYSAEDFDVANDVFDWLGTYDDRYGYTPWENPQLRIALCGYSNDYRAAELPGARVVNWRRGGGMERAGPDSFAKEKQSPRQEVLILSPACLPVAGAGAPDGAAMGPSNSNGNGRGKGYYQLDLDFALGGQGVAE